MKQLILFILLAGVFACKSKTKSGPLPGIPGANKDSISAQADSAGTTTAGKIDIESFGDIKLGQHYRETVKALGNPGSKSKAVEWGADGLLHEDWTWPGKGLTLNLSSETGKVESSLSVFSITAKSPCTFKTKAGVGIGSSYNEVQAAYKGHIDPSSGDTTIIVGSVYGGIIFTFKEDKVSEIFLGAAAE
ncbi:MAG: hypothetical protein JNM19_10880 [Chitinophagaceae bacterium]|nr:hypothetical protein [Chitinophagaceae bacterium]